MNIIETIIQLFVLLFAIVIHEASHGWAASKFGDMTARSLGRVSLNPLVHIDPVGTVLVPLMLRLVGAPAFGWAKPVPVNPFLLKNPKRDHLWISFAGPASNFLAAFSALVVIMVVKLASPQVVFFLRNFLLGQRSMPKGFYPLEGLAVILFYVVLINIYIAVFNLIPVPPLDGSGILTGLLSDQAAAKYERLRPFGFIIVLGLVYMGFLDLIIRPIQIFIYTVIIL